MSPAEQLAARWLADVPRSLHNKTTAYILEADAIAAIARLFAPGDELVERAEETAEALLKEHDAFSGHAADTITAILARISALTATVTELRAEKREMALQELASLGQAQEAYEAQLAAEAERDEATAGMFEWVKKAEKDAAENATLRDRLARLEGAGDDWDALMSDARAEAAKAMRKFPQPNYVISKIAEEAGEVVKAAIHCAEGRETADNLRGEMKQNLAMLYRLWVEGDQVHGLPPVRAALTDGGSNG